MFLLYTLITGLCTYSCFKYSKNRRYTNLLFDRFHVEAPKHMMSLIEFNEETNDDDSHLYRRMYTDYFYDDYLFDENTDDLSHQPEELTWTQLLDPDADVRRTEALGTRPKGATLTDLRSEDRRSSTFWSVGGDDAESAAEASQDQMTEKFRKDTENILEESNHPPQDFVSVIETDNIVDISDKDNISSVVVPFPTKYEELYMNPRKYKIMKKRKYFGNDQRPLDQEEPADNILEKIRDNIQKKQLLDFLQQPINPDHILKIKAYEKVFPKPVFSPGNILAGGLMKDFDTPEI